MVDYRSYELLLEHKKENNSLNMKTYIVNLERCPERKKHMETLLMRYNCLDIEFIKAVDGKLLTKEEIERLFDNNTAYKRYGKYLTDGEIGCTLSHQICYKKIAEGHDNCALILEDDLLINNGEINDILCSIEEYLNSETPTILLLSGDYWWTKKKNFKDGYFVAHVFDAICTQSYAINKAAAKLLIYQRPFFWADDWRFLTRNIKFRAILPHLIDQDRLEFESVIALQSWGIDRKELSLKRNIYYYFVSIVHKILRKSGKFESKCFKFRYIN